MNNHVQDMFIIVTNLICHQYLRHEDVCRSRTQ